jgi:hypothetical protein
VTVLEEIRPSQLPVAQLMHDRMQRTSRASRLHGQVAAQLTAEMGNALHFESAVEAPQVST